MREDELRGLIEERWTGLEAERATGEHRLRVSPLPVSVDHGPLAVAVDHEGYRHFLVPIPTGRKLRTGLDGPTLQLRRRPLEDEKTYQVYADLACRREDLGDLFTELCVDVTEEARDLPENPVKALYRVLDRWKDLFRPPGAPLGPEQLAGLFGELVLLRRLLEQDSSAHRLWLGPERHRHDFSAGNTAVEVKASTDDQGRRPRIHGLDQLEPPADGILHLAWFRLGRTTVPGRGVGLVELIGEALRLCDDEAALVELLARAGYRTSDAERYRDVSFEIREERWYRVGPGFPGLTARALTEAGVPISVLDVAYTIDLSGETPAPLASDEVSRTIDHMIRGSV
ncbi:PD-(D/E)XK motif protein [Streptomyces sp. NBC_01244]|uniref:PD-(D/E)XK motif protein n=1 Tax=Streptomyces sp. NBC_01244 TaxID=2903797 RepID=UPI002E117AF3|nr:PD-(D/E)XK motif protein [Streptomyces sp. NBC_01244]